MFSLSTVWAEQRELCKWLPALFLDECDLGGPDPRGVLIAFSEQGRKRIVYIRKARLKARRLK